MLQRKRSYQLHQRWGANFIIAKSDLGEPVTAGAGPAIVVPVLDWTMPASGVQHINLIAGIDPGVADWRPLGL